MQSSMRETSVILAPAEARVLGPSSKWVGHAVRMLGHVAAVLALCGVSANVVTGTALALGLLAAVLVALGDFGLAGATLMIASLGDAVDGLLARRTGTSSRAGALFDATADRYQEIFFLGGLAFFFRAAPLPFALTLTALVGALMVSYGSAQAEARGVAVPYGVMRRTERAVCFVVGSSLTPLTQALAASDDAAPLVAYAPILLAIATVALCANASAVRRLHIVARRRSG
jgi:CDP-diacylglycerol---glycerol-3-phosphate 3-phosphatidyltransferase